MLFSLFQNNTFTHIDVYDSTHSTLSHHLNISHLCWQPSTAWPLTPSQLTEQQLHSWVTAQDAQLIYVNEWEHTRTHTRTQINSPPLTPAAMQRQFVCTLFSYVKLQFTASGGEKKHSDPFRQRLQWPNFILNPIPFPNF